MRAVGLLPAWHPLPVRRDKPAVAGDNPGVLAHAALVLAYFREDIVP